MPYDKRLIQHLNTIIDPDGEALLGNFDPPTLGGLPDPSSPGPPSSWGTDPITHMPVQTSRNPGDPLLPAGDPGGTRVVPTGGWGRQPNKNRKVLLTITANDQSKNQGEEFSFAGTEFTSSGLQAGDVITGVTLTSAGAGASAPVGSYPIIPSAATGLPTNKYRITYVNGTLTVNASAGTKHLILAANSVSKTAGTTYTPETHPNGPQADYGVGGPDAGLLSPAELLAITAELTSDGYPAGASLGLHDVHIANAGNLPAGFVVDAYFDGSILVGAG